MKDVKISCKKKYFEILLSTCHVIFVNVGFFKEHVDVNDWNKIIENSWNINNV